MQFGDLLPAVMEEARVMELAKVISGVIDEVKMIESRVAQLEKHPMKYRILQEWDRDSLQHSVNQLMEAGESWVPQGGVAVVLDNRGVRVYAQAMVKA
jgi:hypothetical protein